MSLLSSDSSGEDFDLGGLLVPWKYAASAKAVTCSPTRDRVKICMDRDCKLHIEKSGRGLGEHRVFWKATCLEWAVVQSFSNVEPGVSVWWKQFDGWSMGELQVACYHTDDAEVVSRRLFQDKTARAKLSAYMASFTGAQVAMEDFWSYLPEGSGRSGRTLTVEEVIKGWGNPADPVAHVVMMKARIESMMHTIIRLKNTNNIFREEVSETKKKLAEVTNRLRFQAKKKNKNSA